MLQLKEDFKKKYIDGVHYMHVLRSGCWDANDAPEYIKRNEKLLKFLQEDPRNENGKIFCELYDNFAFHYRAGGNWRGEGNEFHEKLSNKLKEIILDSS